jgi:nucleotide-binding universal stress UspA family protein
LAQLARPLTKAFLRTADELKTGTGERGDMGTIFVGYGDHEGREGVLAFAAERAAASGDDLFVYHVEEASDESAAAIRGEVAAGIDRTAPGVEFEVHMAGPEKHSDRENVSKQKRLLDAITDPDREFEYAVMGNVEHGPVESLTIPSATEAVLESRSIPVVLVPV